MEHTQRQTDKCGSIQSRNSAVFHYSAGYRIVDRNIRLKEVFRRKGEKKQQQNGTFLLNISVCITMFIRRNNKNNYPQQIISKNNSCRVSFSELLGSRLFDENYRPNIWLFGERFGRIFDTKILSYLAFTTEKKEQRKNLFRRL